MLLTGEVGLLDAASGRWIARPRPANVDIDIGLRVSWAPDGETFVSAGFHGLVARWDGRSGDSLASMRPGRPNDPAAVEWLPSGRAIVIATAGGDVFRWDVRLERLLRTAWEIAGRELIAEEWAAAFGERRHREVCRVARRRRGRDPLRCRP